MSLSQAATRLMQGDQSAADLFVQSIPDDLRDPFGEHMQLLHELAYGRLLEDPNAFMAFKAPEHPDPLPVATFRGLIDSAMKQDRDQIKHQLSALSLVETFVIYGSANRLKQAHAANPRLKGAPVAKNQVTEHAQGDLF